jgi:hypothetical protein
MVKDEPKFEIGSLPKGGLLFPKIPQRPFRTISIETEMDGENEAISGVLYACGLIAAPRVESYSSQTDSAASWISHLKRDGTCTGGELITHLLNLEDKTHADGYEKVLRRLRGLERAGQVQYNSNCGGHIHIDAHNFDWDDVWRLYTIFGYMEDVIYRLAGSGSPYGHRSLDKGSRTANGAEVGSYSIPIPKGPFGSLTNLKLAIGAQPRGTALNLQCFQQAVSNCACEGGRHGKLKFCTCNLHKNTIEFRVWNSTGNPRILHAWIAIMQAMIAYCEGDGPPGDDWINQYPVFPYTATKWINTTAPHKERAKQRIEWMLREFVFTAEERKSIIYAVQKSEMGDLFTLRERQAIMKMGASDLPPKKEPRNPMRRQRGIVIPQRTPDELAAVKEAPLARRR